MIAGIGTDIVKIGRVSRAYEKKSFRNRVYTKKEQAWIGAKSYRAADNWAAKEAVVKALGTGFGKIAPAQVEVLRDEKGKPYVLLHGQARSRAKELGITVCHVSISNEQEYAVAFVVADAERAGEQ
ncbi:MAG: holo-ACP synthase [Lachnospiraceae bacterium]|nr:holo-ACP synthase [Lachnospiraceae bacterium]